MKITLLTVGKTNQAWLEEAIGEYCKRLKHYVGFELRIVADVKNAKSLSQEQLKEREGELILSSVSDSDDMLLLDENGASYTSEGFAELLEKKMLASVKNLVLVVGGAYGFSPAVYRRAGGKLSLSKMTFSHQMVRLIAVEQLYRAFTILKNEPYHHR